MRTLVGGVADLAASPVPRFRNRIAIAVRRTGSRYGPRRALAWLPVDDISAVPVG